MSFDFCRTVWREFNKDNGSLIAAAVSFYEFLSLFPLLLFAVAVLAFAVGSPTRAEAILSSLTGGFTTGPAANDIIMGIIHGRSAATGIGLVLLLWSGTTAMVTLEKGINLAWKTEGKRGFLAQRGLAVIVLGIAGTLVLLSLGITGLINAVRARPDLFLAHVHWIWKISGYLVPLLLSIALFTSIYKIMPKTRVPWKVALVGGLFAGVFWEIAKHAFAFYVLNFAHYNKVYGSLEGVILLLVWIDYSAIIAILGAEFAHQWEKRLAS